MTEMDVESSWPARLRCFWYERICGIGIADAKLA
jgi:hypothetical protein